MPLQQVEVDTAHFKGNFPESCEIHATISDDVRVRGPLSSHLTLLKIIPPEHANWTPILSRTRLGPHRQHDFQLENTHGVLISHVRLTIYPDGGVKRLRILGRLVADDVAVNGTVETPAINGAAATNGHVETNGYHKVNGTNGKKVNGATPEAPSIPAVRLTPESFAPFGNVIQAWNDVHAVPRGLKHTPANQGTATKFHKLAPVKSSYPQGASEFKLTCDPERVMNERNRPASTCLNQHLGLPR